MTAPTNMLGWNAGGVECIGATDKLGVWLWRCHCGATFERHGKYVRLAMKKRGRTSCGCDLAKAQKNNGKGNATHGFSKKHQRLYDIWRQMLFRCENPKSPDFGAYGGRGITVCEEWLNSPRLFVEWALLNGYSRNLTIDRIDTNSGYAPENCRWATSMQQGANMRKNRHLTFRGETLHVSEWARRTGMHRCTIQERIKLGWTDDEILSVPPQRGRNHTYRHAA